MSEKKTELKDFEDIAKFLRGLEAKKKEDFTNFNKYVLQYLGEHQIKSINPVGNSSIDSETFAGDNSLRFFLRRALYCFIQKNAGDLNVSLATSDKFRFESNFPFACLNTDTTKAIFDACKKDDGIFQSKEKISEDVFDLIVELCKCTQKKDNNKDNNDKNKIFPLDFIIYSVNKCDWMDGSKIEAIFPFIDMSNFCYDNQQLSAADIYKFFNKIPLDRVDSFLNNKQFVEKLGGIDQLKELLSIENLDKSEDQNARDLAKELRAKCKKIDFGKTGSSEETGIKIIDDEDYKQKVKKNLVIYQLPKSIASAIMFLFGIGLFLAAGFAWSVPFLLGIGFLIPSIAAFTNSILCMKPTKTRTWLAKIFKNCAWIIDGALLITLGAVFCAGPLAIAFITFGSLGILMGCFNAFVGTLNSMWDTQRELVSCEDAENDAASIDDIKSEILSHKIFNLVVFAVACAAGVLLALYPAISPIALPFLPALGIGIAVLSGLGVIKSALRLFYDDNSWQTGCYHVAKYIKASMFVLGGLGLIVLPFLPIAASLASVIGMPTLVINIFSFLVGLFSATKGCMSFTRMSSNVKLLLSYQAMEEAYYAVLPKEPIDIEEWKNNLHGHAPTTRKLKLSDISVDTVENLFENQN